MKRRVALAALLLPLVGPLGACNKSDGDSKVYKNPCLGAPRTEVEWANCSLRGANLAGKDMSDALMHNVDFTDADLTGADLSNATMVNITAKNAKLANAKLDGATISGGDIQLAKYCHTTMPDGKESNRDC